MKNRIPCLLLGLAVSLSLLSMSAQAASTGEHSILDGTAGGDTETEYTVTISGGATASPSSIKEGATGGEITIKADNKNQSLPTSVVVTMGGNLLSEDQFTYDKVSRKVIIHTAVTGDIHINSFYKVTLYSTYGGATIQEDLGLVDATTGYSFVFTAPAGYTLPSTVRVRAGGETVNLDNDEDSWYKQQTGELMLSDIAITGDVVIKVRYPSGTLIVGGVNVYQNGKVKCNLPKGVSFDAVTQTLSLEGVDIHNVYTDTLGYEYGIYADMSMLNIVLSGTNNVILPLSKGIQSYGIYTTGSFNISGSAGENTGTLNVISGDVLSGNKDVGTYGVYVDVADAQIFIEDATVNVCAGNAASTDGDAKSYGLYINYYCGGYGGMHVSNSTVSFSSGSATASEDARSVGMSVGGYEEDILHISDSTVSAVSGNALGAETVLCYGMDCGGGIQIIDGSQVTAIAGMAESTGSIVLSNGVYSEFSLDILDSQLYAFANRSKRLSEDDGDSTGLFVKDLVVCDSEVKASGDGGAIFVYGRLDLSGSASNWYQWASNPDGPYTQSSERAFNKYIDAGYLHILPCGGHLHTWEYTACDGIITAECSIDGCTNRNGGHVVISSSSGLGAMVNVESTLITGDAVPDVFYSTPDGRSPRIAGTYTASIAMGGVTATVEYTITEDQVTRTKTTKAMDGITVTTVTDLDGNLTGVTALIPKSVAKDAAGNSKILTIPVEVPVSKSVDTAVEVKIEIPGSVSQFQVKLFVSGFNSGTVVHLSKEGGIEETLTNFAVSNNSVVLAIDGNTTVKLVDNNKYFTDVHSVDHWASNAIDFVVSRGLFTGIDDNTFDPDGSMSRAMLVTVLWRLEGEPTAAGTDIFTDVADNHYYAEAVRWAAAQGIVTGYNDGAFGPSDFVTREQLAAILWRYAQYKGVDISVGEDTNILSYEDAFDVSEYAYPAVQWACGAGVMNGKADSILAPQGQATRAEVAQMLKNYIESVC